MGILSWARWPGILALLCVTVFLPISSAKAQSEQPQKLIEEKIKAGLVYNFLKYTIWPDSPSLEKDGRLKVCLFGDDAFDGYLSPMEGRTAQKMVISISRISQLSEIKNCNLLFVHRSRENSLDELFGYLRGRPVLTVSDIRGFSDEGGMIELATENERINFHINKSAMRNVDLVVQDRILKLAKSVSD